ncbi:beta-1,6-N-acetylglucosaminyltransferase [Terriglobus roseus]|nr:beta-1,6-N-acetylglucosaminyltransferase [Terriglobus roseus]
MSTPRIAFLILAHQDPEHLERLCGRLGGHGIFVHVDGRATQFPLKRIAACARVTIVPRSNVHWGDFSMVEATLTLLHSARAQGPFDRYVLLSGACYPMQPIERLEAALTTDPHKEWISLTPIAIGSHLQTMIGRRWRMAPLLANKSLDKKLRAVWNKLSKMAGRNLSSELNAKPYFGNQFWGLSDACVQHILSVADSDPAYRRAYASVYAPDEHFFHTIVGNSKFAENGIAVPDQGAATNLQTPLHIVATTGERYFAAADNTAVSVAASGKFFLRKVSTERSAALLDRIDSELLMVSATR